MQDMRDLYRAYSAVHDTTIKEELDTSKDQISVMNLGQLTESDLLEVCEEIVEGLFQYGCVLDTAYEVVGSMMEATTEGELPAHRRQKIVRISEAFDKVFEKVATRAERNCEEEFLKYRTNKPLTEKWHNRVSHENGNEKLHAALIHEDRETIKGGLIEMLSDIIEARKPGESMKDYARRLNKDTSKVSIGMDSDPLNDPDDDGTGGAGYQKNVSGKKVIRMASKRLNQKEEKDSSYLETDMKKREKNNEKARKDMEKVPGQKNPHFEEVSTLRQGWANAYASIYEKKLDPVGKEDGDVDNDGDEDSSDSYLKKRRSAIGKAMKEEGEIRYPTEPKKKFSKDKNDPGVAAGRKAAKEMGLKHNEEVENVEELYKGKHGQTEKQYQDSRSDAGKMVSGDSKGSGANYSYRAKNTGANPAGGSQKPQGQARMGKKDRDYLAYRKANMKKEEVTFSETELKAFEQIVNSWVD